MAIVRHRQHSFRLFLPLTKTSKIFRKLVLERNNRAKKIHDLQNWEEYR